MKRTNRSIAGRYVGIDEDGRRPSTAAGQPAELLAPDAAVLEDEDEDDSDDDFVGAGEDEDELDDESFGLEP